MSEDKNKSDQERDDSELERKIRSERTFSLEEAIGRLAGSDLLKGDSPIPKKRQAEFEVERYLERNLIDSQGALDVVLLRRVRQSEIFLKRGYENPTATLALVVEYILSSDQMLHSFVTEVDREWGRMYQERPHLQKEDTPPHPDDPYTFDSVRTTLTKLLKKLGDD